MIKEFVNFISSKEVSDGAIKDYQLTLKKIESDCNQNLNDISQDILKDYIHKMKRAGPVEGIMSEVDKWYAMT